MTDTGQVPGEGLPEGAGNGVPSGPVQGMEAQQPGVSAQGTRPFADAAAAADPADPAAPAAPSDFAEHPADDDDLLLMPGAQGAWSEGQTAVPGHTGAVHAVHQPGPHETSGRDSGSVDLTGVRMPGATPAASHPGPARRPLHHGPSGPVVPDSTGSPVRSLADRGPAGAPAAQQHSVPVRQAGPPTTGPEYLDIPRDDAGLPGPQLGEIQPQGAAPWAPEGAGAYSAPAETVVPEAAGATAATAATGVTAVTPAPESPEADVPAPQLPEATEVHEAPEVPEASETPVAAEAPAAPQPSVFPQAADAGDGAPGEAAPMAQHAAELGQAPVEEQQFPMAQQQFPVAEQQFPPAAQQLPAEEQPAFVQGVPAAVGQSTFAVASAQPWESAQAPHAEEAAQAGFAPEARHAAPDPHSPEPRMPQEPAPIGQFVPVEGTVPTTPHLAPTPPHPVVVPQEDQAAETRPVQEDTAPQAPAPEFPADPADGAPVPVPPLEVAEAAAPEAMTAEPSAAAEQTAHEAPIVHTAPAAHAAPAAAEEQAAPEEPAAAEARPEAAGQPAVTVPGPRDGAQPTAAPAAEPTGAPEAAVQQSDVPEAAPQQSDESPTGEAPAEPVRTPQVPPAPTVPRIVSSAAAPTEFPAAPETADPADELDEADEVISFEPIEANEVTEVAEAPEMAEAPEAPAPAPETAEAPEALAPVAAQEAPEAEAPVAEAHAVAAPAMAVAETAEAPEPLIVVEPTADPAEPAMSPGTAAPGYADAEREAVLRVMRERRDIRNGFRSDPIPHEVLLRVLEAAHTAPSVGHSQPWDFVVIKSADTRRSMHELAMRQRDAYAKSLPKGRAKQFKELKIEAILDTPVNIVVTADPTRGGRHTLGRHTQPQMAPYSSALAVENLWLAARAEGLGVGWVSFFDEREMVRALGLPEHLEVVAYLCVGYVDEFPDEPELMQAGWSKRRPLSWVVHEETYGRRALPGEDPHDLLAETVANIRPLDAKALGEAWERQKRMTKPPGALGMLEIISAQLSGLSRMCPPPIPEPAAVAIFAGDHGVHAQGVTAWPQEVTAQMVANFLGGGAVCNAFANQVGAEVCVIDVGVASELPATPGLLPRKVRAGTADMTTGPALTREEVKAAIEVGIETARDLVAAGNKALLTGEMGIANTTASAALISVYTEVDPAEVTGRGTGINDEMHSRKVEVVRRALDLHQPDPADPIGVLAAIGGLEHAAMVGLLLGGASLRTPVILDGVSAGAAALVARAIAPEVLAACIAGHRSAEPGHVAALNKLGLRPLVDLDLRLGEGTGALLALPVVQSAARAMHEVATFDSAGVTEK
ncbi:nicotinate-nucleotide--dimethylbenzimidazole phosphoribosyltransferase [Streptomyces sp. NPDC050732]|uniref:nicotinate-nucleotide--dimethylbenzimidazole phosphoribosyltransferase n=1 Tax=Streptomyces sp. NPDC050732 TaxID=3154632 RepID=UPI0034447DBF